MNTNLNRIGVAAALCAGLALGGSGCRPATSNAAPAAAHATSNAAPADLLAAIPDPTGKGLADLAVLAGKAKARQKPDDPAAWVGLGDALMQQVRDTNDTTGYSLAKQAYEKALGLDSKSVGGMLGLAWVHGGRHEFEQSVEWANKALAVAPTSAAAYGLIGDADVELGDYDAALKHYQKMLDIRPDMASYSRGAHLLWLTGDTRKGMWLMAQAVKSGGPYAENGAWCRAQLAEMLFNDGALLPAEQVIAEALKLVPDNRHCLIMQGRLQAARKKYDDAIATYKKALALSPDHKIYAALADIYLVRGDKKAAEEQFAAIEELHAKHHAQGVHDHTQMALFYADHNIKLDEALRLAEAHKSSNNVQDADALAWCYYKAGRAAEAKEAIGRALRWKTPDARILFHAGMIYAKLGDGPKAKATLYRALSLNPNFSPRDAVTAADTLRTLGSVARR